MNEYGSNMATKMGLHTEFGWISWNFFDDESVISTFRNKKMAEPKWPTKN